MELILLPWKRLLGLGKKHNTGSIGDGIFSSIEWMFAIGSGIIQVLVILVIALLFFR